VKKVYIAYHNLGRNGVATQPGSWRRKSRRISSGFRKEMAVTLGLVETASAVQVLAETVTINVKNIHIIPV